MAHRWDPRAARPDRLVCPVRVDPAGVQGPTRAQARGRYWRRTSHGWFVPADTRSDLTEQRVMEVSVRLPPDGAVTGWAACRLHGAAFFDGLASDGVTALPVPVVVGPHGRRQRDDSLLPVHHDLPDRDRSIRFEIATVVAERATFDAVRLAPDLAAAVVAIDMAAAGGICSLRLLAEYAAERSGVPRQVVSALTLADEHSASPAETRLRLVWQVVAGLPRPLVNCPVRDARGCLLGVADLLDLEAGLVVEYDGADHRGLRRHTADVVKDEALRAVGLEVVRVTGLQLRDSEAVADRLLGARSRALSRATGARRWQACPPPDDLHQRLAERAFAATLHGRGW